MTTDRRRIGSPLLLAATAAVMVVSAVGLVAIGAVPPAAASGSAVVAWFQAHQRGVQWSVWSGALGIPPYATMIALQRRLLPQPHRDVYLIGGTLLIAMTSLQQWFLAGLAFHAETLQPAVARSLLDVAIFWGPVLTGVTTTMIAPVTIAAFGRQATIPRWIGVVGAVAFVEQAIETVTIFGTTGFTEPGGAMNLRLGGPLTLVWLLAFGFWGGLRGRTIGPDTP